MQRVILFVLVVLLLLFFVVQEVKAIRSVTIASDKSSLHGDEEMLVTASVSGFTAGENVFVKGAFYQDSGSKNYFGYTKDADDWVRNSETTTSQKQVKIGEWDGSLIVKGDFNDSGYKGEGEYLLKVGFYYYNTSQTLSSVNWSTNILNIYLNEPDPTSNPTPTSTSVPTSAATLSPTPISTKTPTPTPKPTKKSSPSPSSSPEVLGENTTPLPDTPSPTPELNSKSETNLFPFLLMGSGAAFLGAALYPFIKNKLKLYNGNNEIN